MRRLIKQRYGYSVWTQDPSSALRQARDRVSCTKARQILKRLGSGRRRAEMGSCIEAGRVRSIFVILSGLYQGQSGICHRDRWSEFWWPLGQGLVEVRVSPNLEADVLAGACRDPIASVLGADQVSGQNMRQSICTAAVWSLLEIAIQKASKKS